MAKHKLRVIPLGGLGEVGKNMMLFQYGTDAFLVDGGLMFPENDMLGVDFIIPDYGYLLDSGLDIHGMVITHGHEDHIGGLRHFFQDFPDVPLYGTPLTTSLIEVKLKRDHMLDDVEVNTIETGETLSFGPFKIETFHVCHSIPDGIGLGITTPVGLVVHSGDFKFDYTPVDGRPPDFAKLADFGGRGVLALFSDSTNADSPGWTPSEMVINDAFDSVFQDARGRIIVATFASLISRVQQVADAAKRFGRKMAITGYTMREYSRIASRMGYLDIPASTLISLDQAKNLPPHKVVIMATGTQGEPSAVMGRLATGRYQAFDIENGDTVIMSAQSIPGNEEMVHRIINRLLQRGADVIYDRIAPVHVSGHASQEEQKLLLNLLKPKFFIPIHGELRHLHAHARTAESVGIPRQNIAVVENGTIIDFTPNGMEIGERVPGGYVFVDGLTVGDVSPPLIREREILAREGFLVAMIKLQPKTRRLAETPQIISRGFMFLHQAPHLLKDARDVIEATIGENADMDLEELEESIRAALSRMIYKQLRRRPMIFIVVDED
jgi:ribonuclease J